MRHTRATLMTALTFVASAGCSSTPAGSSSASTTPAVGTGAEVVFMPSVNKEWVYLQEYHSRLRPGSHHLLNYVQPSSGAPRTSTGPEACNQTMNFPDATVINSGTATVPANAAPDFRLLGAIPHFHAHTTDFKVYATRRGVRQLILEQFGTLDSPYELFAVQYDSATQNLPPDEATHTPGAFSGILHLEPGDTIDWQCTQTNDGIGADSQTFTTPLSFTEQVFTGEMCNLFGVYAPTTGTSWNALGLSQTVISSN